MATVRTAVIGVGYLGKYHAEKYAALPHAQLVAVCDVDPARCTKLAKMLRVDAVIDYQSLIGKVDAVSVVVPTSLHHTVGQFFLSHGIHVLMEKPITISLAQADDLIRTAQKNHVILQVGHLERFNNAIKAIESSISNPRFIESIRLAPFKLRGSDVNVILDLMIHDIDIIQSIVNADINHIAANGASVITADIDIANARIDFANGCVANVTASRVSTTTERKLRIFQHDSFINIDLDQKEVSIHRKGTQEMFPGIPEITREIHTFDKGDALKDQITSFLQAIIENRPPVVSGEDGKQALATALEITRVVNHRNERYPIPPMELTLEAQ